MLDGLTTGDVQCLLMNGTYMFAGTDGGGIFLTSNNGTSWNEINNGLQNLDVRCLAIKGNDIYAGTYSGGIFVSSNRGGSWKAANNGLDDLNILSIVINDSNMLAGTDGHGIYLSKDSGKNWTALNNDIKNLSILSFADSSNFVFCGTKGKGVYFSVDYGINWRPVNNGLTDTIVYSFGIYSGVIFAGTNKRVFKANVTDFNVITIQFSNPNPMTICEGDTVQIEIPQIIGGIPPYSYQWKPSIGFSDTTIANPLAYPIVSTPFTLTVTDNSKPPISATKILTINVNPKPIKPQIIQKGDTLEVTTIYQEYAWYLDGVLIIATEQRIVNMPDGEYYVVVKDNNGCSSDTSNHIIVKQISVDLALQEEINFIIYPNPVNDVLKISYSSNKLFELSASIINNLGFLLIERNNFQVVWNNYFEINTSNLPTGVYFCIIKYGNYLETRKFIIIR